MPIRKCAPAAGHWPADYAVGGCGLRPGRAAPERVPRVQAAVVRSGGWTFADSGTLVSLSPSSAWEPTKSSLRRLRTDWIDLYQIHRPDPATPIEETLSALDDLVHEGKVRYIGSSNLTGWQVSEAEWMSRTRGWPA